jgi:hypothetical protein
MRKLVLALGGSVLVALVAWPLWRGGSGAQSVQASMDSTTAWVLAAGDTAGLPGPRQPIFFRHDIHSGQYKMLCQYCHYSVGESSEPGIPSLQACMGCHLVLAGADSATRTEIQKVRDAYNEKKPVEWVRVHALARHARFPHMLHIKAMGPNACGSCHGDVARMPQIFKVNNINNMGWCIDCHIATDKSRDCSVCHY